MNINAMGRSASRYDDVEGTSREARAVRPAGTIMSALSTVTDARHRLAELAEEAERIASAVAGSQPTSVGTAGEKSSSAESLTEALNERAEALQDPMLRIQGALARISRSIGA